MVGGRVYFVGFNAKLYCLDAADLQPLWTTDLRNQDLAHKQPVQTFSPGDDIGNEAPPAAGWSSPLVVNGLVYLGIGEGENPDLFSFVFCLDAATGDVVWIFCTNKYADGYINKPNELPASVLLGRPPAPYTVRTGAPVTMGCSVWGSIAYDEALDRLYCPVGNGAPDGPVPTPGWSNGLLSLDAKTGAFAGFFQIPPQSNYRDTDIDVDVGASPILFTRPDGRRVVAVGCKNGTFFVLDADSLAHVASRQLLPKFLDTTVDEGRIPTVDPNPNDPQTDNARVLKVAQRQSAADDAENYSGIYSTAAVDPDLGRLFVGVGGNNYHPNAPGIDTESTPFLRALDWDSLADAWPVVERPYLGGTIQRYARGVPPLYANLSESGLSSPAVANDVVFMATTWMSLYAFAAHDGTLLFEDRLGQETGALNGGYGYCMGPAVCGDYVVAGALVFGGDGGVLRIYRLKPQTAGG